jgi:hypothetical protein
MGYIFMFFLHMALSGHTFPTDAEGDGSSSWADVFTSGMNDLLAVI